MRRVKGYRLNPDANHVIKIITGLEKKDGHCPCRVNRDETTLCPCDEFTGQGICKCNLFIEAKE